jgi:hypothetical protein
LLLTTSPFISSWPIHLPNRLILHVADQEQLKPLKGALSATWRPTLMPEVGLNRFVTQQILNILDSIQAKGNPKHTAFKQSKRPSIERSSSSLRQQVA